jgi:pyridoxamine 5'-phosphate oxidase
MNDLAALREEYTLGGLDETDVDLDPVVTLRAWLDEAIGSGLYDPTAMVVSTVSAQGLPSSRMVLLKGLDARGLVFFTNYGSRKGEDLTGRGDVAAVFPWHPLQRQVRVEGIARRLSDEENDVYFAGRPRGAQVGAWASPQSEVVADRAALDAKYAEAEQRFGDGPVPRPPHWGGYLIEPHTFEFWQGRQGRLHDRLRYRRLTTRPGQPWLLERLAP